MFEEPDKRSFAQREHDILSFWNQHKVFEQSIANRHNSPTYTFYDGPPFATGLPHYGHLLAGTIKDVVCRFMTMKGYKVPRRFGWDCHGLPIESIVEKKEGLSGGASIREYGIAKFNETCRENVLKYTQQWRGTVTRMGRWVDMDHTYKTMDITFMESVWWVFKQLFDQGLVYKGYKVMPFSWKLGTPLSNFEAGENYRQVDDPSLVVSFQDAQETNLHYLAWTTTPWTLVSNMALVLGPDIEYVQVRAEGKEWILAKERLDEIFKNKSYAFLRSWKAHELQGRQYKPLFNDFIDLRDKGAFRVLVADFVSTGDGTGIVHAAPAFGEDDFEVCRKHHVPLVCPINENGLFDEQIPRYKGQLWKDCQKEIIREIKQSGHLFSQASVNHRYPFCYRTDTPLIYRVTDTWFIAVEKIKDRLIANNEAIHWIPSHIKDGRFGKWLEGVKDWAISRNRFWGTPIPLWQAVDGQILAVGSRKQLEALCGLSIDDLHRHFIDDIVIEQDGKQFRRVDAVFDCWFESGSMPYAQSHYPFENKETTEKDFPADFIAEGLDQTRGWFYTLHVLSCALFNKPAFKNVIVNGIVLAEDGTKMSKRLQNYPDPLHVLERYGADALRLYLLKSPVVRAEDLSFSEAGVDSILKQVLLPWWNVYIFFSTYARLYKWSPAHLGPLDEEKLTQLDQWILSRLQTLVHTVDGAMQSYRLWEAVAPLTQFIDELTNWYIRRSRRRFWSDENLTDRAAAMHTLYQVLLTLCKVAAPFAPFLSETLWKMLKGSASPASVHLCDFPIAMSSRRNTHLEKMMTAVQKLASMGHGLRKEHRLRVRQPLRKAWIVDTTGEFSKEILAYALVLQDELNVKEIGLKAQTSDILRIQFKPNFKNLGPRAGKLMKQLGRYIEAMSVEQYKRLEKQLVLDIQLEQESFELQIADVAMSYELLPGQVAAYEDGLAIALETYLDEALILEGMARELVNKVNTLRKERDFYITDRINLVVSYGEAPGLFQHLQAMLDKHRSYICEETLCEHVEVLSNLSAADTRFELADNLVGIDIEKALV